MELDEEIMERIKATLGEGALVFEEREWGVLVRKKREKKAGRINRVLVLNPGKFTGMNPHPRTEYAVIDALAFENVEKNKEVLEYVKDSNDSKDLSGIFLTKRFGCVEKIEVVKKRGNRIEGYWHGVKNISRKPLILHLEKQMTL